MKYYCLMINLKTFNTFKKYFDTEFERDKYKRKSYYSTHIKVLEVGEEYE